MVTATAPAIKIFSVDQDAVVKALVATGRTDYKFAIKALVPLVDRLEIQRRIQNPRFYERLKRDLFKGCLMPPITLAFVKRTHSDLASPKQFESYIAKNISKAFVLDGIQRLSTLKRAFDENKNGLNPKQPLFVNILVCRSMDNLLYRMITLNNGQRPMTTRHQIEILSANRFHVADGSITLTTEKKSGRRTQGVFAQADFVLGYMAFLSNSITVDSQKLIQEKLDELIASKILEHDPSEEGVEFSQVTEKIAEFCDDPRVDRWFKLPNNLIGFCAGVRQGYPTVEAMDAAGFAGVVDMIESAFSSFDVSKIKLGRVRRAVVAYCMRHADLLADLSVEELTERLVELTEQQ